MKLPPTSPDNALTDITYCVGDTQCFLVCKNLINPTVAMLDTKLTEDIKNNKFNSNIIVICE